MDRPLFERLKSALADIVTSKKVLMAIAATIVMLIVTPAVLAQDAKPDKAQALMILINLIIGFVISGVVSGLKKIRLVQDNPKKVAAFLSALGAVLFAYFGSGNNAFIWIAILSFCEQLGTAIGTFETVIKPASAAISGEKDPYAN